MSTIVSHFSPAGVSGLTGRQPVAQAFAGGDMRRGVHMPGGGRLPRKKARRRNNGGFPHRNNGGFPRRSRRGLIGMLLTIVVAVVIVVAIFAAYNQVTASSTAAQTAVFVRQLAPQITNQYRGNYAGLTNAAAISSGFVPDNWVVTPSKIDDPNGRDVEIAAIENGAKFTITIADGVPSQTCKAVLGALKSDPTFVSAKVGGGSGAAVKATTQAAINTECAKTGNFVVTFR